MYSSHIASRTLSIAILLVVFSAGTWVGWAYAQTHVAAKVSNNERPIGDIRKDVTAFIKRSKSKESDEKAAAVFDLCLLHREIVNDPRFEIDNNLIGFRATIGSRLKKCKREIEVAQKREIRAQAAADAADEANNSDEMLLDDARENLSDQTLLVDVMSEHLYTIGQVSGGPTQIFNYANGNFGGGHANELIELIESTIAPSTWRSAGGNGQIFYYRPVLALVVSANLDVHDRIGDLLRTLR